MIFDDTFRDLTEVQIGEAAEQLMRNPMFQKFAYEKRRLMMEKWVNGDFLNVNEREEAYKTASGLNDLLAEIHIAIDRMKVAKQKDQ